MQTDFMHYINELPEIPEQSALAFKNHLGELVEKVNSMMASRADVGILTGNNPVLMMFDNHKNHALFMSNVFSLGAWELLVKTIPWVYRTYYNYGFDYAYFPAHFKAWCRALEQLLPPDDAAPLIKVYEWMQARHEDFIRGSEQYSQDVPEPAADWRETCETFVQGLLAADRTTCMEIAAKSAASANRLADFYLNVIQPAMYAVGSKWEAGEISVAKEHLASAIVNRIMSMQYLEVMKQPAQSKGKAVVTASANEFHEIGTTMVANLLEADGWDVAYLGANTPVKDFLEFVSSHDFYIVAISASMVFNLESIRNAIEHIRSWSVTKQPWIMVGGLVFNYAPELAEKLGADGYAPDCRQAVVLADKWLNNKRNT
ncbi:MAG: cobalamin-dependent protein [Desulfobacteraceae bacterium]|nr:cobalamin-dependent protein [Desulfobacteraceae bacterium]